jgi:transposase
METAFDRLSQRQLEIVHLVTRGLQNKEVAHLLGISMNTVRNTYAISGTGIALGDLNGDRQPDLVVAHASSVYVFPHVPAPR